MSQSNIYNDIAKRTGGDIYIGVVGPVRTGKSTFIRKFMDLAVVPAIENEFDRERTIDQIPQSASGRTIMTTEPKFVPDEAVSIKVDGTNLNVKMVDCVGYVVDGALGESEDGQERLVNTPWSNVPMPLSRAAEIGTDKVIEEHSTIAMLVSTDGSFGDITRESFVEAEERIVSKLKESNKPFAIILNSAAPHSKKSQELAISLEEKYSVPCALVDATNLNNEDIREILGLVLSSFPIKELKFHLPIWIEALPDEHPMREELVQKIKSFAELVDKIGDVDKASSQSDDIIKTAINAGDGVVDLDIPVSVDTYYSVITSLVDKKIENERDVIETMTRFGEIDREYRKIETALRDVNEKGYGIVMPSSADLRLEEPRLAKQSGGYGVKLSASASTIHMIKADIKAELCPVVGTAEQTEEVVKYLSDEFAQSPDKIWESNMFGKSLYDLVNDGMNAKLINIPDDSRKKIGETIERIVNEGANGLICILL